MTLIFIDSPDIRYRTIHRCINGYHMYESLMDVVANIALVVESEKGLFRVTAVASLLSKLFLFPVKMLDV